MNRIQKDLVYASLVSFVLFVTLTVPTNNSSARHFLFDNLFVSQLAGLIFLFLRIRGKINNGHLAKGLKAAILASVLLIIVGNIVGKNGPRVMTESDHPSSIMYLCYYYGDDFPLLKNHEGACFIKNSVTAASNPAWLLIDSLGVNNTDFGERTSQILTFLIFETIVGGSFMIFSKTTRKV